LAAAERGALKLPILDRGAVLALFVAFPAGFICGFCTAPILYLAAYKDQWTNSSAMLAGGAILTTLIVGLLAAVWFFRSKLIPEPAPYGRLEATLP
jgi:biotin transporter BioY